MSQQKLSPLFSIIVPLYNREELIRETLESIQNQTFQMWECIIVDDHSDDKGYSLVQEFAKKDGRFKCFLRPDNLRKGANTCRNFGLKKARGKFIYWLDSDDIAHPDLLEYSFECLNGTDYDYVRFERQLFFGEFDRTKLKINELKPDSELTFSSELIEAMLINELEFNTCNVVWRRASLNQEDFCEDIVYGDEWEYYSRLLMKGLKGRDLKNILIFGRKHRDSTTAEYRLKDPVRLDSQIHAAQLILRNLIEKGIFTRKLKKFFLRLGFELKSYNIIKLTLNADNSGFLNKLKYKLGYRIYPLLKPVFNIKAKIIKN